MRFTKLLPLFIACNLFAGVSTNPPSKINGPNGAKVDASSGNVAITSQSGGSVNVTSGDVYVPTIINFSTDVIPTLSGSGQAALAFDGTHILLSTNGGAYAQFGGSSGLTIGSTAIASGSGSTNILYDNSGTLGEASKSSLSIASSGANTDITSLTLNQTGLSIKGATSNALTIKPNETLTAGRTLNYISGDSDRTLTLNGNFTASHNVTIDTDGTGTRTLNIGAGGTLGSGAFAAAGVTTYPTLGKGTSANTYSSGDGTDNTSKVGLLPALCKFQSNNVANFAGRANYVPFYVSASTTFTKVVYYVSANNNGSGSRLAFYSADTTTGLPLTRLTAVETGLSVASAGWGTYTLANSVTVGPGWFWIGFATSAGTNFATVDASTATQMLTGIVPASGTTGAPAASDGLIDLSVAYSSLFPSTQSGANLRLGNDSSYYGGHSPMLVLQQ